MLAMKTHEGLEEDSLHESITMLVKSRDLLLARKEEPGRTCSLEDLLHELLRMVRLAESEMRRFEESIYQDSWGLKPWQERKLLISKRSDLCRLHMILLKDCAELVYELDHA